MNGTVPLPEFPRCVLATLLWRIGPEVSFGELAERLRPGPSSKAPGLRPVPRPLLTPDILKLEVHDLHRTVVHRRRADPRGPLADSRTTTANRPCPSPSWSTAPAGKMAASPDFEAIYAFAIKLALEAGSLIAASSSARSAQGSSVNVDQSKKNRVDREQLASALPL